MQFLGKLWRMQEKKRNYLVPKPIYHTTKFFTENELAIEMKKIK